ncbi:hypothetical protein [Candidatus Harpocratesius sp.]
MPERSVIIKPSTAEESTQKYFQTIQLILTRFKRASNREEIYKLTTKENTLSNLLVGACAIQCYHYLGIRTQPKESMISRELNENLQEIQEKKDLFDEITLLFNDMLTKELDILLSFSNFELQIMENLLDQAGMQDFLLEKHGREHIKDFIYETFQIYPDIIWLDIIGKNIGYLSSIKDSISQAGTKIRATSIDLEQELVSDGGNEKYIELSTIQILLNRLKENFKFKSLKEIHINPEILESLTDSILQFQSANVPRNRKALTQYLIGIKFRIAFFEKLKLANNQKVNFEKLEQTLKEWIIQQIKEKAVNDIGNFKFFLQKILDFNSNQVKSFLKRYGFDDLQLFGEIQSIDSKKFLHDIMLNQLTKEDFVQFNFYLSKLEKVQRYIDEIYTKNQLKGSKLIAEILKNNDEFEIEILHQACDLAKVDYTQLKSIFMKKLIISSSIQPKYPLSGEIENYIFVFDIDRINNMIAEEIFFNLFSDICVQIARIYESYVKVKKDKSVILLGLKRIFDSSEEENWVRIKIEELIIHRLIKRQQELAFIFDIENDSFLINAFIYARLFDCNIQDAIKIFTDEPALFFSDVGKIKFKKENFSPRSYVFAYEILERFKTSRIAIRKERIEIKKVEKEKEQAKRKKISEEQQLSTFNWIEKKITSALISVSAITVNPTSIYWTEKDNRLALESLLIHAKLSHRRICMICGKDTTTNSCQEHSDSSEKATPLDLISQYYYFALSRIQELWSKIKIPTFEEIHSKVKEIMEEETISRLNQPMTRDLSTQILDGELRNVGLRIVKKIGKQLDKAIYKKFKANLRKNRG